MTTSPLDAFDLLTQSQQLELGLDEAVAALSKRTGFAEEKAWLEVAVRRVTSARDSTPDIIARALRLPELIPVREGYSRVLQGTAVDALERLHAGITFAGGNRAPLLEALYWKLKIPVLRRCCRKDFETFWRDFEKRLESSYAQRILADASYQIVAPAVQELRRTVTAWLGIFTSSVLEDSEAQELRDELDAAASRLDVPCRQARLLAHAALAPLSDFVEIAALVEKSQRRRNTRTLGAENNVGGPAEENHQG